MKKKRAKKPLKAKKTYIIHVPVQEVWEYKVEAYSEEEALRIYNIEGEQLCSFSGNTGSGYPEVVKEYEE